MCVMSGLGGSCSCEFCVHMNRKPLRLYFADWRNDAISADPRSGVSEHLDLGRFTSPLPPSALGVATGQHQNPRRVLLKGRKSLGGSRLKVKNLAPGRLGEKVDENMIFGGRRPNVS